jgi:hypothetical protein
VIEKYSDIPNKICPEEPLPSKFFRGTSWESATAELGLTHFPMVVPILFGMSAVEASVHDDDFEEKLRTMSPKHTIWAKLIKEHFAQNENNEKCVDFFSIGSINKAVTTRSTRSTSWIVVSMAKSLIILLFKPLPFQAVNGKKANRLFTLSSRAIKALFAFLGTL